MKISLNILLFLLAIFLLRFPPLYFFGIQNTFFTTHIISVMIFVCLFLVSIYKTYKEKEQPLSFNTETILILIFFITQSLSIIGAQNILVFLQRYSKIFIGFLLYLLTKTYVSGHKNKVEFFDFIIKILLFGSTIAIFLQLLLFVFPDIYFGVGQHFIYKNVLDITSANFKIGKIFDDSYLEIVIPLLVFYFLTRKSHTVNKFFSWLLILLLGFIAFVSNFRYRFLAFFLSLIFSFLIFKKKKFNFISLTVISLSILFLFWSSSWIARQFVGFNVIERLTLQDEYQDYGTIQWRLKMFQESIDMAKANIFGVGLGNFYDNISGNKFINTFFNERKKISLAALQSGPHNIFFQFLGETGFVGLFAFIFLLGFFIKKDLVLIKQKNSDYKKVFVLSFWTLIFIVQFFPAINLTFYSLLFMLRALI